jgi:hypothetical protein
LKNIFSKKLLGIPLAVIIAVVLTTGVALAATIISNVWSFPEITVGGLVISSPDFNATTDPGGRSINNGGVILSSINLSNPNPVGTPSYENVMVNLVIHKAPGVETSDVVLEYQAGGSWHVITFNKVDPQTLSGTIGSGGVSVPSGYNVTTPLRATFKGAGKYQVQAQATN